MTRTPHRRPLPPPPPPAARRHPGPPPAGAARRPGPGAVPAGPVGVRQAHDADAASAGATAGAGAGAGAGADAEWWQRLRDRSSRWWARHPAAARFAGRALVVGLWLAVPLAVVALAVSPELRLALRSFLPCWLLLVAWFLLARTKTLRWSSVSRVFGLGVPLSVAIAWVSARLAEATDLTVNAPGPSIGIASAVEEVLKLAPIAVLCLVAPGRARRFAVVDWLLVGMASGMAFQALEDAARRIFLDATGPNLSVAFAGGDPWSDPQGGLPQYGWSLLSGWSDDGGRAFYAGHHMFTALVAVSIGLAVRAGGGRRSGRVSRARQAVWALPVLALLVTISVHAAYNAVADSGSAFADGESSFPAALRLVWQLAGQGRWVGPAVLVLALVGMLVDARQQRRAEPLLPPHPAGGWPAFGDRWGARLVPSRRGAPGEAPGVAGVSRALGWWLSSAGHLVGLVVRDLRGIGAALARPRLGDRARPGRWVGMVAVQRERRELAQSAGADEVTGRRGFRLGATAATALTVLAGLTLALWVTTTIGDQLIVAAGTLDATWLAGLLDRLAGAWDDLGLGGQLALTAGLAALIVLSGGSFGLALGLAGGLTWIPAHGRGAADFVRDPERATRDFVAGLTPQQVLTLLVELGLERLVPAGLGARLGTRGRALVDDYLADPQRFRRTYADVMRGDRGSASLGPDPWTDPGRRQAWRDRWLDRDRPTEPSRYPSSDNEPRGRPETIRPQDDAATTRGKVKENESARTLSEHGFDVEQSPTVAGPKNPDYVIEGEVFDAYSPEGTNVRNIASNMETKVRNEQTHRIVLNLDSQPGKPPVDPEAMRRQLTDWPIDGLDEVIVVRDGDVFPLLP